MIPYSDPSEPDHIFPWVNLGLIAVLGRLRATANFRRIAEELWPFVGGPPSTPMGEAEAAWWASLSDGHRPVPQPPSSRQYQR